MPVTFSGDGYLTGKPSQRTAMLGVFFSVRVLQVIFQCVCSTNKSASIGVVVKPQHTRKLLFDGDVPQMSPLGFGRHRRGKNGLASVLFFLKTVLVCSYRPQGSTRRSFLRRSNLSRSGGSDARSRFDSRPSINILLEYPLHAPDWPK